MLLVHGDELIPREALCKFAELCTPSGYRVGVTTLNALPSFNELSLEMIRKLTRGLRRGQQDEAIAL